MNDRVGGVTIIRLPYQADPEKADPAWATYAKSGQSESKWKREMEMDAHAGAMTAIFGRAYRPDKHERRLTPILGRRMLTSFDFGEGFPARVWAQRTQFNGLRVYASTIGEHVQLRPFVEQTLAFELHTWGEFFEHPTVYCDPAGNQPKDDGLKSVDVLRGFGWSPRWRGSRIEEGIEEIERLLTMDQADGEPMFQIDPRSNASLCQALKSAYRRDKSGKPERIHPYIDVMDSLRYLVVNTKTAPRHLAPAPMLRRDPDSGYGMAVAPRPHDPYLTERS